ncbi:unannotated protein [freshwater metagenome]|uniref:Unannotated protein n=1 Tax=freshwater metagenome TaxID=449393 RepID=A0A6J7L986_9ZZZZ
MPIRAIATVCSITLGLTLLLSACGQPDETAGGITVPALWANDSGVGGIEPAGITVNTSADTPNFAVNLEDVDASGAGPAWRAATASAVATATLLSGVDPRHLSATYTITGPIDGPSAGAILTVGTLAAIRGRPLDPTVTMTGTVSPDGSIGRIGGVGTKIKAAADNNFGTVLLPTDNLFFRNLKGERIDAVVYGSSLGVAVRGVGSIAEAYQLFTGHAISAKGTLSAAGLLSPIADTATIVTSALIRNTQNVLDDVAMGKGRSTIGVELQAARAAFEDDDHPTAYGLAADAYKRSVRQIALEQTSSRLRIEGSGSVRSALLADAAAIQSQAEATITETRAMPNLGQGQQALLPTTLRWAVLADAYAGAVRDGLATSVADDVLVAAAMTLAGQRAGLDQFLPDALQILDSMSNSPAVDAASAADFASGYSHFLLAAADANSAYLLAVFGPHQEEDPTDTGFIAAAERQLASRATNLPRDEAPLGEQVQGVAQAIAYYLLSAARVDALQVFGTDGFGSSVTYAEDAPAMERDIEATARLIDAGVESLGSQEVDICGAAWSAAWAKGLSRNQSATQNAVSANAFSLTEIWFSAVSVQMLNAARSS